jgi:Ser/Thr protein kinase RdoA (MazF antagonist)
MPIGFSNKGGVTILDFDLCGRGWRAYDIASYLLVIKGSREEEASPRAFLNGYEEIRPLKDKERETLPLFEAVRAIFSIGIPAMNVSHWGSAYLHAYLDSELERLKQAMKRIEQKPT